jgi:hypothetical protein
MTKNKIVWILVVYFAISTIIGAAVKSTSRGIERATVATGKSVSPRIFNDGFDAWTTDNQEAPDGWGLGGAGASVEKESKRVKSGAYSAKLTRRGDQCFLYQNIKNPDAKNPNYWKGRTVTFGFWVYATVENSAALAISDGASSDTASEYHRGDSTWQWLSVTKTLDANATRAQVFLYVLSRDASAYFDGVVGV